VTYRIIQRLIQLPGSSDHPTRAIMKHVVESRKKYGTFWSKAREFNTLREAREYIAEMKKGTV